MHDLDRRVESYVDKTIRNKALDQGQSDELLAMGLLVDLKDKKDEIRWNRDRRLQERLRANRLINIDELIHSEDGIFVDSCYAVLLGCKADSDTIESINTKLHSGEISKREFIDSLLSKPEAASRDLKITGYDSLPLGYFLQFYGREFIEEAYIKILRRYPEPQAITATLREFRRFTLTRVGALYGIINSEEAKRYSFRIDGLDEAYARQKKSNYLRRKPVIGKIYRWFFGRRLMSEQMLALSIELDSLENRLERSKEELLNLTIENKENRSLILLRDKQIVSLKDTIDRYCIDRENQSVHSSQDDDSTNNSYYEIDYFDFENHFRGSIEEVKKNQKKYLKYFDSRKNVLDLGCGRGEFTELLVENGIGVTGVDLYRPYVDYMLNKGLPVIKEDVVEYLRSVEKTDGIFLGQVVEHLGISKIIELCELAYDRLEEGSYLIMETPNPMTLLIYTSNLYLDPSHDKPIHPYLLQYVVRKAGFSEVEIVFTEESKPATKIPKIKDGDPEFAEFNDSMAALEGYLYGSQDYAIIARK